MSRKEDILTALRDLNDQDLRTAGAALFDALGYRSTRTFEDLPTDPTSFWDFFSQGHSDLDPGKAEIERWRGATFLFQLTDAEVHGLAKAREATKEQGDYEESEIESFLFLAIDLVGEQWTRTRLAQITRTLNRLFLMPAIVLFRHGGLASLAVIDRRQSKVDAAKDVILAKKIAIVKDIRLAKPHRAHIDILEKLTFANLNRGRNITTFRALYDAWLAACSVETLTKEFFTKLSELFFDTSDSVATRFPDENERRLFVQTLFNRLIFLRFVEEKGWMKIDGRYDYLQALWEKARDSNQPLWPTRLNALFGAVNHPISDKVHEVAKPIIGTVPYLNGGLFEEDSRFADPTVQFPDVVFDRLVGAEGLLYRYLFTVEESTPLDVQVAVDPEILGKIFEQLTIATKRHDTGSYYTPREIVQFMCREALVGYLTSPRPSGGEGSGVRELPEAKARALVYDHDDSTLTNQEGNQAFEALKAIKVVDPACGSGAYLLGMLQELYALFEKLRRSDRKFSDDPAKEAHERKLWIIENNIYGVDLQAFATNTAMLRLWLTLLVEDTGERPQPLPNLEYKIETGDSLLGPDPSQPIDWSKQKKGTQEGLDLWDKDKTLRDLRDLRETYQNSHADKKTKVKKDLEAKLAELREKVTGSPIKDPVKFDWRVEFFDVFLDDPKQRRPGFDVALANPPYGVKLEDAARNAYFNRQTEGAQSKDSYGIFMARALQLLAPGRVMCYIVSDTWRTIKSHLPLRKRLLSQTTVQHFIDLPSWIFDATVNTGILTLLKGVPAEGHKVVAADLRPIPNEDWNTLVENLNAIAHHGPDLQTLTFARYTYPQADIATYENCSFFIASPKLYRLMSDPQFQKLGDIADVKVGLQTGDNEYYLRKREGVRGSYRILDESKLLADAEIAGLSEGEKRNGVDPARYGGRHFVPYDKGGESDAEGGWMPNYWVPTGYFLDWSRAAVNRLRTATLYDVKSEKGEWDKIKDGDEDRIASRFQNSQFYFRQGITFSWAGVYSPTFRYNAPTPFDHGSSTFFSDNIGQDESLGLCCSTWARYLMRQFINHTVNFGVDDVADTLVPRDLSAIAQRLGELVRQVADKQRQNGRYLYHQGEQREIDALIYELYGLEEDDIREVTLWYCRRYRALAEAQGVLAEAREKHADHLAWCDFILSKPPSYWTSHPLLKLIAQGESERLEFKQSLEYVDPATFDPNIPADRRPGILAEKHRGVLHSALKTVCAFLNSPQGGTLLIGVHDKGEIIGITPDLAMIGRNPSTDGFEGKLRSLIRDRITNAQPGNIQVSFHPMADAKTVCQVDVTPNPHAVYLDDRLYVRDGNGTIELAGPQLEAWLRSRP